MWGKRREETALEGIPIGGVENKICLYTDDVLITLKYPESGVLLLVNIMGMYGRYSGYALNVQKTLVLTFNYAPFQELTDKHQFNWYQSPLST